MNFKTKAAIQMWFLNSKYLSKLNHKTISCCQLWQAQIWSRRWMFASPPQRLTWTTWTAWDTLMSSVCCAAPWWTSLTDSSWAYLSMVNRMHEYVTCVIMRAVHKEFLVSRSGSKRYGDNFSMLIYLCYLASRERAAAEDSKVFSHMAECAYQTWHLLQVRLDSPQAQDSSVSLSVSYISPPLVSSF